MVQHVRKPGLCYIASAVLWEKKKPQKPRELSPKKGFEKSSYLVGHGAWKGMEQNSGLS